MLVLESTAPGGQAGTSSRIENYLGFPTGISGLALMARAYNQAQKFGVEIAIPDEVASLAAHPAGGFALALAMGTTLSTPVMMAYWFAPLLAGWKGLSAPKALFFSFVACARNWRPFLGYALSLLVFGALLPGVVVGLVSLLSPLLGSLLSIPLPLVLLPVVFASFYVNACEVFGKDVAGNPREGNVSGA